MAENRFNLVDEPWIPVANTGLVSLRDIFTNKTLRSLGGNATQKLALLKFLLALSQAACTPDDNEAWDDLGADGLAKKTLAYLEKRRDYFWLYGDRPFLQMPLVRERIKQRKDRELAKGIKEAISKENAKPKAIGYGYYPDIPSENNTILTQSQIARTVSDAEKALFVVMLMNFAFGGKRVEKDIEPFSSDYAGKSVSAKSGPSLGNHWGYLHSFIFGASIVETLWLNLVTKEFLKEDAPWEDKTVIPPWEEMPTGEADPIATRIKKSYMGRLVAMSRFVLLENDGIYYIEGIQYPSHKDNWRELSMAVNNEEGKVLWVDTHKKPWRNLTALLAFLTPTAQSTFDCPQIKMVLSRIKNRKMRISVWSGGLKVRANSGDQSVKQDDDFVESEVFMDSSHTAILSSALQREMKRLENLSRFLFKCVSVYCREMKVEHTPYTDKAGELYWQLCERKYQELVNKCQNNDDGESVRKLRPYFFQYVVKAYETYCPRETARQLQAWVKGDPRLLPFLTKQKSAGAESAHTVQSQQSLGF
jgi:CRISPR system Cascade subunit CasA